MRDFVRDRGLNLLYGGGVFFVSLFVLRLLSRRLGAFRGARKARKNLATRVVTLLYSVFSFIFALLATLFVFNLRNDWLLVGITLVFIIALIWIGVRMLPRLIEQITLYLNLGAVQEGERVFFNGIPWLVRKLDFYCDLHNPVLEGGEFSIPIRELIGLHSRPVCASEPWFPTRKATTAGRSRSRSSSCTAALPLRERSRGEAVSAPPWKCPDLPCVARGSMVVRSRTRDEVLAKR